VTPVSPLGIESVSVEAHVTEGEVGGVSPAPPAGLHLPPSEVPVPLVGTPGRLAGRLAEAGLDAAAFEGVALLVPAGAGTARSPTRGAIAVLPEARLRIEAADGAGRVIGAAELLDLPATVGLRDLTVGYDTFADRFLLAGVAGNGGSDEPAGARVVLGVSGEAGRWTVTAVPFEAAGLEGGLIGIALDEETVYLLVGSGQPEPGARARVVSISKGAESDGFYAGGTARFQVTAPSNTPRPDRLEAGRPPDGGAR